MDARREDESDRFPTVKLGERIAPTAKPSGSANPDNGSK